MKKLVFISIIFFALSLIADAALTGNGTFASPWSGTLEGDATWSGTKYINGDIIVDNEKLTISPGAIIIFLAEGADLIITGTGQLEADGSAGSMILFTSDDDNDGNYGESGETWGHISFQSMTGSSNSLIDYSIIEYGKKNSTPSEIESYGGGLHLDYSNVIISNSIIRYNYAGWGGGIFVNIGENPSFINCIIRENISANSGGGLYLYQNTSSRFENCIVAKNTCTGGGGGGGIFMGNLAGDVRFFNCVIVSNASSPGPGGNIRFYVNTNPSRPRFYNSIVWGSNNSINYITQTIQASDFNFCALQGGASSYISCININATNDALDGPNFVNPSNLDYSIKFISPCRDMGTSSEAPLFDLIGNSRIYNYDIGAYESQYSRWTGTSGTDWTVSGNWDANVDPSSGTGDLIIPTGLSNYPVSVSNPDFTVGSGKQMIIEPGARVTLNNLTNNGTLKLNHNSSGFASLILSGYTRGTGGTEEIQLYLTGGGSELLEDYKWHYISTPVSSLTTNVFTDVTIDLADFVESRPSTSLLQGWVAYDGYVYSTGATNGPTFSSLTPGKGYNFWGDVNYSLTFGGQFNTSNVAMSLPFTYADSYHGYNLLGNPFSSGLNWDDIVDGVYFTYPLNTSKGLYFTRNNVQCTYIGGVGVPGDVNGIIPPMQGFFTKTFSAGNSITLPAAARTHSDIHPRYKGSSDIPLVRLQLSNDTADFDETVVRFDEEAKTTFDNDFDALKMFISESKNQIYTSLAGTDYAINGQPFPLESSLEVPAVIEIPVVFNVTAAGTYKISSIQLQGLDPGYNVTLIDNTTGFIADLKTNPEIAFSSGSGTFKNRFKLTVSITTGIEKPESSKSIFNIYPYNGMINIVPVADDWIGNSGSVNILDITGKYAGSHDNIEFQKNTIVQLPAPEVKGLYFLEIKSGLKRYVGKVIIK